jgi:hypothetical protein
MKVVAIVIACGCLQAMVNGFCEFWEHPFSSKAIVDSRWECPSCGNDNGDWTSICGRCGRSRPSS